MTAFDKELFDMKILASSHLHFFFGSGVNGKAFPQFDGFIKTISSLKNMDSKSDNLEQALNEIQDDCKRQEVLSIFENELEEKNKNIQWNNPSILNIRKLFSSINKIVINSENRTNSMKQVNIYTLNYDSIIEDTINEMGLIANHLSSTNIETFDALFNIVAYDYSLKKYIPTYLISHLHGDLKNPVLPGVNKYDDVLQAKRFELLFKMKEHLTRRCSVLFVIGYSGHDKHINNILKDCIKSGLTVYWINYEDSDALPSDLAKEDIFVIKGDGISDSTAILQERLKKSWEQLLEE